MLHGRTLLQQVRQCRPPAARLVHFRGPPLAAVLDQEHVPKRRLLNHPVSTEPRTDEPKRTAAAIMQAMQCPPRML